MGKFYLEAMGTQPNYYANEKVTDDRREREDSCMDAWRRIWCSGP